MRRMLAMAFVLVALQWAAAPLVACVIPWRAMTAQERACCRHMSDLCGSARAPQSHACCHRQAQSESTVVLKNQQSVPVLHVTTVVGVAPSPQVCEGWALNGPAHYRPEFLPDTTVLRI
jgi:hypothetical protein